MISSDRPARDIHQIVEAVVEQLTTLPGSEVTLKLEIDAEVPSGLDRAKVRTLIENANTLGFIEKRSNNVRDRQARLARRQRNFCFSRTTQR